MAPVPQNTRANVPMASAINFFIILFRLIRKKLFIKNNLTYTAYKQSHPAK
jgi:hypothetical protein